MVFHSSLRSTIYKFISNYITKNLFLFFQLQNGYPSRRRSLVDDARFETIMVKQTKQSVLEEAREKANGNVFIFKFTYMHEHIVSNAFAVLIIIFLSV